jgi:hypothetical protein
MRSNIPPAAAAAVWIPGLPRQRHEAAWQLDRASRFEDIGGDRIDPMSDTRSASSPRRTNWTNVSTVISAAILIAAEVFGAAYAGGWAVSNLLDLGEYGAPTMQSIFFVLGVLVMLAFIRNARRVEPFTTD